ncbi:MAG: right-handed parallel beta-helix repeat-containing protein [Puniceicoccaceae bacterium]
MNTPSFEIFVAPHGTPGCNSDGHNGADGLHREFGEGIAGPSPNLDSAIRTVRAYRQTGRFTGPATITLLPGEHHLSRPLELTPQDNGGIVIRATEPGAARLWGGVPVDNWTLTEHKGLPCWEVSVETHLLKHGAFRSLWVEGTLAPRPRWPKQGETHLRMKAVPGSQTSVDLHSGNDRFIAKATDIPVDMESWAGVDVCVPHFWIEERMPVESVDKETGEIVSTHVSRFCLTDSYTGQWARYYFDNVAFAFDEPGQWFIDRQRKVLRYLPREGQTPENTRVVIPVLKQLMQVRGTGGPTVVPVDGIHLQDLSIFATEWEMGPDENVRITPTLASLNEEERPQLPHETVVKLTDKPWASACQAAFNIPGALEFSHATNCSVSNCHFNGIGWYGIGIKQGCHYITVKDNHFEQLGAGAVVVDGGSIDEPFTLRTDHVFIDRNHIHHNGYVFPGACGILSGHAAHVRIADNHLHNLTYSGISAGWTWAFADTVCQEIRIERNHIHHLGERADMSDMGGIYLLGKMPGSFVNENIIHDVWSSTYGGWGLYADQGTAFVTFERNLVFATKEECVHEHWTRRNIYRDNLFVSDGKEAIIALSGEVVQRFWDYPEPGVRFEHNTFFTRGQVIYRDNNSHLASGALLARDNQFWNPDSPQISGVAQRAHWEEPAWKKSLQDLQAEGIELGSIIADPHLRDPGKGDFRKSNNDQPTMPFVKVNTTV